jgi:putative glutamine amidotransferase
MKQSSPLVWLPADHRNMAGENGQLPYLFLGHKYAHAVKVGACAQPVLFPLADADQIPELLNIVDGVLLTGSPANVHPSRFGELVADEALPLDPERDALTLALVHACLDAKVPLLGICRGFQEINVALGGSLHQQVQSVPGLSDHREDKGLAVPEQYDLAHEIRIEPGTALETWAGGLTARVNSLHGQGVAKLAPGLTPLAYALDGLVEAFGVVQAHSFAYAVQWHPEWRFWEYPFYAATLKAFGQACEKRRQLRTTSNPIKSLE